MKVYIRFWVFTVAAIVRSYIHIYIYIFEMHSLPKTNGVLGSEYNIKYVCGEIFVEDT